VPLLNLSHGRHDASSMARRGMNCGPLRNGMVCLGTVWPVMVSRETTIVLARRPINAAVVGSLWWCRVCYSLFRQCKAVFVPMGLVTSCSGVAGQAMETTPVQARFPIDAGGVGFVGESPGEASRCGLSRVTSWNQARAGTEPDQRRRLGMGWGRFWRGSFCCVGSMRATAGLGELRKTTTRSARFRFRRRMVACVWLRPGRARYGGVSPVMAW
jgi:hypothetical protein